MPRLPPSLVLKATRQGKHLPALLTECRDLSSARNELRWLTAHAVETAKRHVSSLGRFQAQEISSTDLLSTYVKRRSRGEPLQYILGNQPFGELEIFCRRDVLIPRPETELYTTKLAHYLRTIQAKQVEPDRKGLRILDLCTGSGCIALLLHSLLRQPYDPGAFSEDRMPDLQIAGLDISQHAVKLAEDNKAHNIHFRKLLQVVDGEVTFHIADVLHLLHSESSAWQHYGSFLSPTCEYLSTLVGCPTWRQDGSWDVVISNPPYISESDFVLGGTTTRSVRTFEPKLALVPPEDADKTTNGDIFYQHILSVALELNARVIVMEVGDSRQASRVGTLAQKFMQKDGKEHCIEVWRDDGSAKLWSDNEPGGGGPSRVEPSDAVDRAVVIWRRDWSAWRRSYGS